MFKVCLTIWALGIKGLYELYSKKFLSQPAITRSTLTIEQGVKYVQN